MQNRNNAVMAAAIAAGVSLMMMLVTLPFNSRASQNTLGLPTTGVFSGLSEQNSINNALDALLTCNSGASAPTNALGGAPKEGQCWLDTTSATLKIKKRYSGSGWVIEGVIDVTNGLWIPAAGGGSGAVASSASTDLCTSPQPLQTVSGTTTITSFGSSCVVGIKRTLIFSGAVLLTYNATSLILPGQVNYTTTAGDVVEAFYLGSGNWRVTAIDRINGQAVINPSVEVGTMHYFIGGTAPTKYVFGFGQALTRTSFPDYVTAATRAQTGTLTSGNNTITSVADTSSMGAGMPIEGTGIPAATTISSVTGSTIVMSANATTNGSQTNTVFFTGYGVGGSSSTIGVPDCRGRVLAGRDDMGGTAAGRLTASTITGDAKTLNAASAATETKQLATANLPAYTPAGTITNGGITINGTASNNTATNSGSNAGGTLVGTYGVAGLTASQAASTFTGTAQGGTATAFSIVQPTLITQCIVRVITMNLPANDNAPIARGRQPVAIARRFA